MIRGELPTTDATAENRSAPAPAPWPRAHAARDADRVATRPEAFVDATRRGDVRHTLAFLRGAQAVPNSWTAADRRAQGARLLADSVERQARISGLGRVTIPVGQVTA